MKKLVVLLIIIVTYWFNGTYSVHADWPMAGANAQRTSWVSDTMPNAIKTVWVKPLEAFVSHHVQVIGADNKVFVSTSKGLYAFDANTGNQLWVYPTELPLGNSPTYSNGVLYVGGVDRKLRALNSSNGQEIWTFPAQGGFYTNPIVANGKVLVGNRDGAFYAVSTTTGQQIWKYQTNGQINYSPAQKGSIVYFASDDGFAYALNVDTGSFIWKSDSDSATTVNDPMPSKNLHSWWPVIYTDPATGQDYVIFTSTMVAWGRGPENAWFFPNSPNTSMTLGRLVTDPTKLVGGDTTMDVSDNPYGNTIANYFETFPERRHYYVFDISTGKEKKFDIDGDNIPDAVPGAFVGDNGTTAPPIVSGFNNILYLSTVVRGKGTSFAGMTLAGWKFGTPYMSLPSTATFSSDEPHGISGAGNKIYWNHCDDRNIGAVDISVPDSTFPATDKTREFGYMSNGGLNYYSWPTDTVGLPVAQNSYYFKEAVKYFWDPQNLAAPFDSSVPCCSAVFWDENDTVAPSIYQGKIYVILGNALVALGACTNTAICGNNAPVLPSALISTAPAQNSTLTITDVRNKLETQVAAMVRPLTPHKHYLPSKGEGDTHWGNAGILDDSADYWHDPAETFAILIRSLPFLSSALQQDVKSYLQEEMVDYSPALYSHVGWLSGIKRDVWPYPASEARIFEVDFDKKIGMPAQNIYAVWKYVQAGLCTAATNCNVGTLYSQVQRNFPSQVNLADSYFQAFPHILNAQIDGFISYIELAKLTGQQPTDYQAYQDTLTQLLSKRKSLFMTFPNPQSPYMCDTECYFESLITAWNFMYMTPELADYLRTTARSSVVNDPNCVLTTIMANCKDSLETIDKYLAIAPYWMVAHNGETQGEFTIMDYRQTYTMFQALAQIKKLPQNELIKYLDNPIVPVGDLYYIDNLVAVLEASPAGPTPTPIPATIPQLLQNWFTATFDQTGDGIVNSLDFAKLIL